VELPVNKFQCPSCGYAFQRTAHAPVDRRPTVYGMGKNRWVAYPTGHITLDRVQVELMGNDLAMRPKRLTTESPLAESSPADQRTEGSSLANGSARPVAVTERLVRKIVERARASEIGLHEPEASLELGQYAQHNKESLALMLVSAWTEKYDLVSIFAAAMSVIEEEAQNEKALP
jgi:hypothetical protein